MAKMRKLVGFLTALSAIAFFMLLFIYIQIIKAEEDAALPVAREKTVAAPEPFDEEEKLEEEIIEEEKIEEISQETFEAFYIKPPDGDAISFDILSDYIGAARENSYDIYYRANAAPVIKADFAPPPEAHINDAPVILQDPELPRGCEVTALAMLTGFFGIKTDKITLAQKVKKDTTPREIINGKTYWGNPNNGFVGDMYNMRKPGFGVYHAPIFELLKEYEPERAVDLTGASFADLQYMLCHGTPVWVIINTRYAPLAESSFRTWHTPDGEIRITYHEHAALLTGYDSQYVYLNDPLSSYVKTSKKDFILCWEQMGSQAVTVCP